MDRRTFLQQSLAVAAAASAWRAGPVAADDLPKDLRVTRVVGFELRMQRSKIAGKNARLDVHGDHVNERMLRIYTNDNKLDGFGGCNVGRDAAAQLLGRDLKTLFDPERQRISGPLGARTMPLWDLAGKALGQPVFKLLGGAGQERVPVYDGSIYFADLLPQYADKWPDRFREEIDMGRRLGHRAFKIKIGRGSRWMPRAEGDERDLDVVRHIREHDGEILIGVDANNGYDLAGAKRFLERGGKHRIAFVEELFPEVVEDCLELKKFLRASGFDTLLADGETQSRLEPFEPFIAAKAIDVLQGDMNHFGIEGILTEAEMGRPQGILVAPHNWGSLMGYYQQLHVGRAIKNFYRAEHDPLSTDAIAAEGYDIKDGTAGVSDAPGFGLVLDEEKFSAAKITFDLRA
jgi:L-alanine-DL-glutamate epimerase-like enolase superfamily enzyme